jgi:hemerythrin-like domain-containing protein
MLGAPVVPGSLFMTSSRVLATGHLASVIQAASGVPRPSVQTVRLLVFAHRLDEAGPAMDTVLLPGRPSHGGAMSNVTTLGDGRIPSPEPIGVARVLREEEQARDMARWLADVAERGDPEALSGALDRLEAMLNREFEVHLTMEENDLFPVLAKRGLELEVVEATRQHAQLRALREGLSQIRRGDVGTLRAWLRTFADQLQRHVRYEADFLYVDLCRLEAAEFRADVDAALTRP